MKAMTRFCGLQRFLSVLSVLCMLLASIPIHLHLNVFAAEDTGVLIADNGKPAATIVISNGADAIEELAAEELQYRIETVSSARLPINLVSDTDVQTTIIIATPDSYPLLNDLFPEDIAWLKDIGKPGDTERYGDDGFAIPAPLEKVWLSALCIATTPRHCWMAWMLLPLIPMLRCKPQINSVELQALIFQHFTPIWKF